MSFDYVVSQYVICWSQSPSAIPISWCTLSMIIVKSQTHSLSRSRTFENVKGNLSSGQSQLKVRKSFVDVAILWFREARTNKRKQTNNSNNRKSWKVAFFALLKHNVLTNPCLSICVGILLNASTSPDENDSIDVELQCDMLFIVSSLCEVDTHRKVRSLLK